MIQGCQGLETMAVAAAIAFDAQSSTECLLYKYRSLVLILFLVGDGLRVFRRWGIWETYFGI